VETINKIELTDASAYPDESVLKKVLGVSYGAYLELLKLYESNNLSYEWRYYRDGKAWLCKVQHKKRTIVWMSAWKGYMQVTIYFPERVINDVFNLSLTLARKWLNKNNQLTTPRFTSCTTIHIFNIKSHSSKPDLALIDFYRDLVFSL